MKLGQVKLVRIQCNNNICWPKINDNVAKRFHFAMHL